MASDSSDLQIIFFLSGVLYLFYFIISPTQSLVDVISVLYTFTYIIFIILGIVVISFFNLLNFIVIQINSVFNFNLLLVNTDCLRSQIVPTVNNLLFSLFSIFPSDLLPSVYPKSISIIPGC